MLTSPRFYSWDPNNSVGQPFVEGETLHARLGLRRYLIASDGHRIPFPRRVLNSPPYQRANSCQTRLYVETENRPYPGVAYVMEINLPGRRNTLDEVARISRQVLSGLRAPSAGRTGLLGPAAAGVQVGANILLEPSPLAGESHWTQRVELAGGTVTVRYDYLP